MTLTPSARVSGGFDRRGPRGSAAAIRSDGVCCGQRRHYRAVRRQTEMGNGNGNGNEHGLARPGAGPNGNGDLTRMTPEQRLASD
jgi:hypothetical protein